MAWVSKTLVRRGKDWEFALRTHGTRGLRPFVRVALVRWGGGHPTSPRQTWVGGGVCGTHLV